MKQLWWAEAEILEGHGHDDPGPARSQNRSKQIDGEKINAEAAVEEAHFRTDFRYGIDELTQQRASDLGDIKTRLIKILLGIEEVDISAVPEEQS